MRKRRKEKLGKAKMRWRREGGGGEKRGKGWRSKNEKGESLGRGAVCPR